jgi:hypothetical protein
VDTSINLINQTAMTEDLLVKPGLTDQIIIPGMGVWGYGCMGVWGYGGMGGDMM